MIDPRPGDSLLFLGADDLAVAGQCGAIAGLNGRTVIVDSEAGAASRIEAAGGKWGALLEHATATSPALPFDTDTFHVTVAPDIARWPAEFAAARVKEALRVTRPAGRIVLIAKAPAGLLGSRSAKPALTLETVLAVLSGAGAVANRRIASVKGTDYYEGRKPRST
jgi:hypothetical protein